MAAMKALNPELVALRKLRIYNLTIRNGYIGPGANRAPWLSYLFFLRCPGARVKMFSSGSASSMPSESKRRTLAF